MTTGSSGAVPAEPGVANLGLASLRLEETRGFVFDVDGTLVHRGSDGRAHPAPGALEVIARIRDSRRPLVLFTNGSHMRSEAFAQALREDGLPIADEEMLTPTESAISYLRRHHAGESVLLLGTLAIRERLAEAEIPLAADGDAGAVLITHVDEVDLRSIERAARAVAGGAALLTGSYARGYAGASGIILSRGAMVTAAIAKGGGRRPTIVGKPSRVALAEISRRLGVPGHELAVIGDDAGMDIALGKLGGARTVLVRSGISGQVSADELPLKHRPDVVIDAVADLLPFL
jgi:HAD superfamily hydrolase (TIGR01450 family)